MGAELVMGAIAQHRGSTPAPGGRLVATASLKILVAMRIGKSFVVKSDVRITQALTAQP